MVPREGKAPLISLFVLRREPPDSPVGDEPPLVVRDRKGQFTAELRQLRADMGLPV